MDNTVGTFDGVRGGNPDETCSYVDVVVITSVTPMPAIGAMLG